MRKRILIVGTLVNIVLTACFLSWSSGPRHHVAEESYARIVEGMTEQEVETIFGCPPGDYGPGRAYKLPQVSTGLSDAKEDVAPAKEWLAGESDFCIGIASDGRVHWKEQRRVYRETWFERIRRKIGL